MIQLNNNLSNYKFNTFIDALLLHFLIVINTIMIREV